MTAKSASNKKQACCDWQQNEPLCFAIQSLPSVVHLHDDWRVGSLNGKHDEADVQLIKKAKRRFFIPPAAPAPPPRSKCVMQGP